MSVDCLHVQISFGHGVAVREGVKVKYRVVIFGEVESAL